MDQLTDFDRRVLSGEVCPYCKCDTKRVTDREIYGPQSNYNKVFIQCVENSDHYVGTYANGRSLGRLADAKLRRYKREGHVVFDKLWLGDHPTFKSRDKAYLWLSKKMGIPKELTHFGMFDNEQCLKSIQIVKDFSKTPKWLRFFLK